MQTSSRPNTVVQWSLEQVTGVGVGRRRTQTCWERPAGVGQEEAGMGLGDNEGKKVLLAEMESVVILAGSRF